MRLLIALGLVVAACSGSGTDGASNAPEGAGDAGEASSGPSKSGATATATATAGTTSGGAGGEPLPAEGGAGGAGGADSVSSSGAPAGGTGAGARTGGDSEAGQGGSSGTTAGAGGSGSSSGTGPVPQAGSGGEAGDGPGPDACAGVPAWDETVPWTALVKDEIRTLRGELWRCSSPAFCTTHPGHGTAPGWVKVADCADPNEGGEPACQCAEGACCDGCYFRPRSHFCGEVVRYTSCYGDIVQTCGGATKTLDRDYWNLFCGGDTGGDCARWGAHTRDHGLACEAGTGCVENGDQAACVACSN